MAIFNKTILCVNDRQLMAGCWRFGKLKSFETYANDEHGRQSFALFLRKTRHTNIHLLVDAGEEDYRLEVLPHTRGSDRKELLERKLNQIYRGYAFRMAVFIKRDTDEAKSDHFLMIAVNQADYLQDWLNIIAQEQAPLAGIYPLSMTTQFLAKRLKLSSTNIIFAEKLGTGLRQSYLDQGELRMSRLVPFPLGDANSDASFYLTETEKTRLYLTSQRYLTNMTTVHVAVASFNHQQQAFCQLIEEGPEMACLDVDLSPLAKSFGIAQHLLENTPELMHMHVLAKTRLANSLATTLHTKHYRINRIRESLNLATALILLFGMIVSAYSLIQDFTQQSKLDLLISQTQHQQKMYEQVAKDFPATTLPSGDLQLAVTLNHQIKEYQRLPDRMMQVISNGMVKAPEIQVNRLFWVQSNDVDLKDNDATNVLPQVQENKALALPTLSNAELHEIVFLNGEIKHFNGDYRAALNTVNQLAERLKKDAAVAYVEILQAPVNVSSYSKLEGSTTDEVEAKQTSALFKLKVIFKREAS